MIEIIRHIMSTLFEIKVNFNFLLNRDRKAIKNVSLASNFLNANYYFFFKKKIKKKLNIC